jgi:RNA polymerase subunit RPABC4/transcription elongation factor Spt4
MDCEKCGAEIVEGAETCPECGEPAVAAAETDAVDETAAEETDVADETAAEEPVFDAPADEPAEAASSALEPPVAVTPASGGSSTLMKVVIGLVVVAIIAGGAWFVTSRVSSASSPEAAAKAMLEAYAKYDAKGILDAATHDTMKAEDITAFEKQAAEAKTTAKGAASLKNIVVGKSSVTATDKVSVDVTAEWLDPATGKYDKRTEKLILVNKAGKWLVELF